MKPDRCTAGRSNRPPGFSIRVEVFPTKSGTPPPLEKQRGQREKQAALEIETEGSESDAKLAVDEEHCAQRAREAEKILLFLARTYPIHHIANHYE